MGLTDILTLKFLKPYFQVDNKYVYQKIKLIFLPFLYKDNDNLDSHSQNEHENSNSIPKSKINYPDLYIPLMAFITFLLVTGLDLGQDNK